MINRRHKPKSRYVRFDAVTCERCVFPFRLIHVSVFLSFSLTSQYVTDGILLREATLHDPLLSNYSVIILDETHERNLNTDSLLGLVKKIRRKRKDLRLIILSLIHI